MSKVFLFKLEGNNQAHFTQEEVLSSFIELQQFNYQKNGYFGLAGDQAQEYIKFLTSHRMKSYEDLADLFKKENLEPILSGSRDKRRILSQIVTDLFFINDSIRTCSDEFNEKFKSLEIYLRMQ